MVNIDVFACMASKSAPADQPSAAVTRAWIRLMRTQQRVLAAIERDLKAAGLPPLGWYDVLWELKRSEEGRLRPYEIEHRTLLAQHNLSRLLDRMEKEGLVKREMFQDDGRGRWVVLTEEGSAMQSRIWAVYANALQRHVGAKLDDARAEELAGLLEALWQPS